MSGLRSVESALGEPFILEQGNGTILLCLHGIGSSSGSFQPQLDGLSDEHRVVAWDAPGYGQSPDPAEAPGLSGYANVVAELIGRLGDRVHLLGASWGGVIAMQVALDHPELLRSLILADSSVGSGHDPANAEAMSKRAGLLAEQGADAFAKARAPRLLSDDADPDLVESTTRLMAEAIRLPGHDYAAQSMGSADLTDRLADIQTPTLVLCGDQDVVTGPKASRALSDGIENAVYVSVNGAGHVANQERPAAFNAWVASFLQIIDRLYQ